MGRFLILLLLSLPLQAQPAFELMDYAIQAEVENNQALLQRIPIPLSMIKDLQHNRLADIALFDKKGQSLPILIRKVPPQIKSHQLDLEFHRFSQRKAMRNLGQLYIGGGYIDSKQERYQQYQYQQAVPVQQTKADYIIQLNDDLIEKNIRQIRLSWSHQPADALLQVRVQVANDLDHWRTIHQNKNLYDKDERHSDWVSIGGLPGDMRYIRITSKQSVSAFELHRVTGEYEQKNDPELLWYARVDALTQDKKHRDYLYFQQPFKLPAHALRFKLPQGYFLNGNLYAGNREFKYKRLIQSQVAAHQIDQLQQQKVTRLPSAEYKHWWFRPAQTPKTPIQLEWGYNPYELFFINNQQGPFSLAWGNRDDKIIEAKLAALLKGQPELSLDNASTVPLKKAMQAGGVDRLEDATAKPWLTWILWLLLILAVVITAKMALSLYRDMNPS